MIITQNGMIPLGNDKSQKRHLEEHLDFSIPPKAYRIPVYYPESGVSGVFVAPEEGLGLSPFGSGLGTVRRQKYNPCGLKNTDLHRALEQYTAYILF